MDAFDTNGVDKLLKHCEMIGRPNSDVYVEMELNMISRLMDENNVTWQDLATRVEFANSILQKLELIPRSHSKRVINGILIYEFNIDADAATVSQGENAIVDAIANEPYSPVDDLLYIACSTI